MSCLLTFCWIYWILWYFCFPDLELIYSFMVVWLTQLGWIKISSYYVNKILLENSTNSVQLLSFLIYFIVCMLESLFFGSFECWNLHVLKWEEQNIKMEKFHKIPNLVPWDKWFGCQCDRPALVFHVLDENWKFPEFINYQILHLVWNAGLIRNGWWILLFLFGLARGILL